MKQLHYSADFETTTVKEDARVWSWGLAEVGNYSNIYRGTDLTEFFITVSSDNCIVSFFNLAFDGRFILDHLLRRGYVYSGNDNLSRGELSTLISGNNKFYTITYRDIESGNIVEFRDAAKKMPGFSVERIAKTFKHEKLKGEIDYHKPRPIGYTPTPEEWEYQDNDVTIVADALEQLENQGMTRLTVASSALSEYRRSIPKSLFAKWFPKLPLPIDDDIRRAYKGGYTFGPRKYIGKPQGKGLVLDVNSLYPFIMYSKALPYGRPIFEAGLPEVSDDYPLNVFTVTITARLKKNHIPILQIKAGSLYNPIDYLETIDTPTTITVTNIDWEMYNKHYDIHVIEYHGGWKFHAANDMFKAYIDKWSKIKAESEGGLREIAKLYLNSLYGKFGSNPRVSGKYPVLEDDIVKLKPLPEDIKDPVYTAMAVFITAYARKHIITAAQECYPVFAYCDTDSLHLLTDEIPENLEIHQKKMGAYKLEYYFSDALYMGPKKYFENECPGNCNHNAGCSGVKHRHIAGVRPSDLQRYEICDMHPGLEIPGKLRPVHVPGGTVLEPTHYTLAF